MILLNPGPVTLSERVRRSLLNPDLCHREAEFFDLQEEIRTGLLAVYGLDPAQWTAVLMTGSGTAAVDSMMASLPGASARVLVLENGVYGERMKQMCVQYRIAHETLAGSWLHAPDSAQVGARLSGGAFTHLAVVHHETTTGRLTDINALGRLCTAHGVQLLLDGVSSFGAEVIDFTGPELGSCLGAVAATANKCLHGVPGVSFVIARRTALAGAVSRTYYLDLARLARSQDQRNTPFTPAVHVYYGLRAALAEFREQGGRPARGARYAALAEQVRAGLSRLGIPALLAPQESSVVLRAYQLPRGIDYATLHDALKAAGFVIYAGQGDLSRTLFRISTMGEITPDDMRRLLQCFEELI
ncbi:MAG TPA: 2-aminoethylphosphonate aminotransferase [Steroidobacteraceae bacterium]|jgi:2-aminoethylphosphonate-pyruvate transaminase|nr:2-aminoethylphosphonate aminotransferase [Steroidobacteraceae bacterium]